MKVKTLHAILGQMIADGHGHKPVAIDKSSFRHNCEDDGVLILEVYGVSGPKFIQSGEKPWREDGSEAGRMTVVLLGSV